MTGKIKKDFRAAATIQVLLDLWSEWVQKGKVTLFLSLSLSALIKVSSVWLALRLQERHRLNFSFRIPYKMTSNKICTISSTNSSDANTNPDSTNPASISQNEYFLQCFRINKQKT